MKSDRYWERLQELWDQRQSAEEDPQLLDLVEDDAECRELWSAQQALLEGLRQRQKPIPSHDLTARILAEIPGTAETVAHPVARAQPPEPSRKFFLSAWTGWVAAAAALMLVASTSLWFLQSGSTSVNRAKEPKPDLAAQPKTPAPQHLLVPEGPEPSQIVHQPPVESAAHLKEAPSLETLLKQAGEKYWSLADETRDSFQEVAMLLPSVETPATNMGAAEQAGWIKRVGDGLNPITEPVNNTLNFLLHTLPGEEPKS